MKINAFSFYIYAIMQCFSLIGLFAQPDLRFSQQLHLSVDTGLGGPLVVYQPTRRNDLFILQRSSKNEEQPKGNTKPHIFIVLTY